MATRVFTGFRLLQDSGAVCTDGAIAFYEAGTTTPFTVYSDRALTASLGVSVSLGSLGIAPDIWVADTSSVKAVITGTGVTQDTIDYLTVAASTATGATGADVALGNGLVNGAFETWTAGTSFSNISGDGDGDVIADGWYFTQPTAASNAVSRQTALGGQARYALRMGRPAASVVLNELRLWQMLPTAEAYRYRGQEITVSARITAGANFSASGLKVRLATGTAEAEDGDNIAASTLTGHASPIDVTQTITTSTTRYEFTATLSSSLKEVGLQFSYIPVGTAGAADYVQIEDVQIEIGSAASTFKLVSEPLDFVRNSGRTGSGSLVFATSPTLVTPILGTPTSGTLTNCTIPVGGVSGLGTGVGTFLATPSSANLISAVTDETGTGALVFANTPTLVTPVLGAATATSLVSSGTVSSRAAFSNISVLSTNDASGIGLRFSCTGAAVDSVLMQGTTNAFSGAVAIAGFTPSTGAVAWSGQQSFAVTMIPSANDGAAVGTAAASFSDGFWASGAVHNWNNGNTTLTHVNGSGLDLAGTGGSLKARTRVSSETGGTLTATSSNATVLLATAPTIAASVHTAGDEILLYNNTAASMTVTQGGGGTQRKSGTATTGNLTLPIRGSAPVYFISATEWVIGGVT